MPDLSLDMLLEIAETEKKQLEADALRTIRKPNGREDGLALLNQVEGIDRFIQSVQRACNSSYYRQLGYNIKEPKQPLFNRRTKKQMAEARGKVSEFRKAAGSA